jgi:hypothetical protein
MDCLREKYSSDLTEEGLAGGLTFRHALETWILGTDQEEEIH